MEAADSLRLVWLPVLVSHKGSNVLAVALPRMTRLAGLSPKPNRAGVGGGRSELGILGVFFLLVQMSGKGLKEKEIH